MNLSGFEKLAREQMARQAVALLKADPKDAVGIAILQATHATWAAAVRAAKDASATIDDEDDGL